MAEVRLTGVNKFYGAAQALHSVSLTIADGEFAVFVGPSGCGKSTLLRSIAGLEDISQGSIHIGDRDVTRAAPSERDVAMVFQSYALYPHMTVRQNMDFGMKVNNFPEADRKRRIAEAARILQLEPYLDRKPAQLSGGQRQRVAIGRAIVKEPKVFLFDEPLSNLDAKLRVQMRVELEALHRDLKATMVYVTHDQVEAMTMADKIVVLNAGRIEQAGAPMDLYNRPATQFVAGFIGAPAMNFLTVRMQAGQALVEGVSLGAAPQGTVQLGIRPEHLVLRPAGAGQLEAVVTICETLGGDAYLYVRLRDGQTLVVRTDGNTTLDHGSVVGLDFPVARQHHFAPDGRTLASGGVAA
ncbi:MAG: sn-glycerol-3-phosphate ABC transporter ATP-binding protein UgpC [Rhodobacter sp.]|nr:sn-glycerol-3-phosphate ABC transporter ATP-binding protein UgpC [Rhodobacter sp.]MCA3519180.1 sn-glycerol-3-phosphate ABC transporter ATP-binding protein UgpC [Rhodobacter sp.]MCA3523326.1 sn-glycerol-3-phosphate ABC transporter ATP-binding protein UgpC [Rhodobacter sp.]MCA3526348.1 sn-glycerol-3-phosphate ABC transporter ATP-binding protein UgpC [Rhodobacter sp.]MCA3528720.1 sn-glycerol-3-phosphate ABC transporter ATP-binding protein UgpC [Rhodobacter sp.]